MKKAYIELAAKIMQAHDRHQGRSQEAAEELGLTEEALAAEIARLSHPIDGERLVCLPRWPEPFVVSDHATVDVFVNGERGTGTLEEAVRRIGTEITTVRCVTSEQWDPVRKGPSGKIVGRTRRRT